MVQLTLRALERQRGIYILWTVCLALAITGIAVVDVYRQSLGRMVEHQGRKMLGGDIGISARRPLNDEELAAFHKTLPAGTQFSGMIEMTAMVSAGEESRLGLIRFIDDRYPLIGDLRVAGVNHHGADIGASAWVAEDLLTLMNLRVGDTIQVGEMHARIDGTLEKDSSQTLRFGGLAPRVYLSDRLLPASKLLQFGSTYSRAELALLPQPVAGLRARLEAALRDPSLQISEPADLERGSLSVLTRVLDFLGLVGLVTLVLGWVGVYYLGRRWLTLEEHDTALLKCVGLTPGEVMRYLLLKLGVVLILGTALGSALAWAAAQALYPLVQGSLPAEFGLSWSWSTTALVLTIGPLAGYLLLFVPAWRLSRTPPSLILRASPDAPFAWRASLILALIVTLLFGALTYFEARSFRVSAVFLAALAASAVLTAGFGALVIFTVSRLRQRWHLRPLFHLVTAQWVRRPGVATLLITVSALASLLSALVPHLERTLVGDLRASPSVERPSLFLYDIQDEQLAPLKETLAKANVKVSQVSPLLRARLLKVNDLGFERTQTTSWSTREEEVDARMRNRGVNLTYKPELSPSEDELSGTQFGHLAFDQVSVETDYAHRLNIHVGDHLLFDVQGAEIPVRVGQIRAVNWDSFQPNFFVEFRELEDTPVLDAPKTWIMTVVGQPVAVQRLLAHTFSNVSSINVKETLEHLVSLVEQLGAGLNVASRLTLLLGTLVFVIVTLFQVAGAREDWRLLRYQGLDRGEIWRAQALSFLGPGVFGALLGLLLATAVNAALARWVLHAAAAYDMRRAGEALGLSLLCSLIALSIFAREPRAG